MTITHKLTQHYAVTTPPRYLTTGNACKSRFILTAPICLFVFFLAYGLLISGQIYH